MFKLQNGAASSPRVCRLSCLFTMAMIEVVALSGSAIGRTWYIKPDGTGDAPTIQAGVDAASAGDIVLVAAGTYPTTSMVDIDGTLTAVCVAIDKDIDLLSESGPASTTIGNVSAGVAIYVHDVVGSVEISGFRVQTSSAIPICVDAQSELQQNGPFPASSPRGIKCRNAEVSIHNNHISENDIGIELIGSSATVAGEPHRDCRRLYSVRGWSHGQNKQVLT